MIKVGIVGATGYTGVELIRLLSRHPYAQIVLLTSRTETGKKAYEIFPSLYGVCDLVFEDPDDASLAMCDVVFFATPHGVAMRSAQFLLDKGVKIIDLAADFRLQDILAFQTWYGMEHTCPEILAQAVYGLPEVNAEYISKACVVGNPGCYPTTAILGLKPIIHTQNSSDVRLIDPHIIIDAKSGVSGAGRNAKINLLFSESSDNFCAYGVAGHRHGPEIEQGVQELLASKYSQKVRFLPHLVPMIRGMFSTIHLTLSDAGQKQCWQSAFEQSYRNEPFVDVLPTGMWPDTRSVRGSNRLKIAIHQDNEMLTVLVVQDNLVKGAAGQAVQNMNLMFGLEQISGLDVLPCIP